MDTSAAKKTASRSMTSSVNWALLGLVIERPSYGWELTNRFRRVYADVIELSSDSQVYSALNALESRRMVEKVTGAELARQPKPHYRATPLGARSYEDWLVAQLDADDRRQELRVRQLAALIDDPDAALRVIDRWERAYLKGAGRPARQNPSREARLIDELVDEQRRIAAGGMISWLQHARSRFEALSAERAAQS
jgi:DNA-binding PadR family transcriptional regulator